MAKVCALLLFCSMLLSCNNSSNTTAPAPEVDVAKPLKKEIIEWDEYTGRFQAIESVDVRSRVTGYINAIKFKDGQNVKKGDLLFIIDPRPFQYALDRATAEFELSKKQYERATKLQKSSFISAEAIDKRYQEMQTAATRVEEAKLNLDFTQVLAPIDGKISRYFVSVGNLIRKDDTVLTHIVSFNPIHFYFETSQQDLLKYLRLDKAGKRPSSDNHPSPIYIKLQDEKSFLHEGTMDFVDNQADQGTGTILGRAIVPNPDGIIYPGFFGRARLIGSDQYQAMLLPDTAINTDQTRKYVYVVDKNNKTQRLYIELGPLRDSGFYIIKSGLTGDETVVVNGIQRIAKPDQEVKSHWTKLSE